MSSEERWLPVLDFEGLYEVSDLGRVRRVGKGLRKASLHVTGYMTIKILKDGKYHNKRVHVLVLEAFRCRRPKGKEARHLNGKKTDNRLVNLLWGTSEENSADLRRHGKSGGWGKLTDDQVRILRKARKYGSLSKICREFGISPTQGHMIRKREEYKHVKD